MQRINRGRPFSTDRLADGLQTVTFASRAMSNPTPMKGWNPLFEIHLPHPDGFLVSNSRIQCHNRTRNGHLPRSESSPFGLGRPLPVESSR